MKKILSIVFFSFFIFQAFALFTIRGKVIDATTENPLDFVNVALYKQNSEVPTTGVTSDEQGNFLLPSVPKGKYSLQITFVGYNTISIPLNVSDKELNMGSIKLLENSKALKELEVIGQGTQMRFDVDKKVFSIDQSIATSGGSATDALRNIPSVKVDNEGNVSLRKNSSVEVWINGKPSGLTADNRAQILQQMPAESIESVEIMTNPSAKYNPEGTAGIINLVLKKNRKAGYYGSMSLGVMYPDGGGISPNAGASINYSSSKIDAYANIGVRSMKFKGGSKTDRYNLSLVDDTDTLSLLSQNSSMTNAFRGIFMRAGVDYHIDKYNTIGLSGFGMVGDGTSKSSTDNVLTDRTTSPVTELRNYTRTNDGYGERPSLNVNLDYKHDFDEKGNHNLMASISYSDHTRTSDNTYKQSDLINYDVLQSNIGKSKEVLFKADYSNKITETSRLEAGWQSTMSDRESLGTAYDNYLNADIPSFRNDFDYLEQIHAGYITYGDRFNKLSVQAGLRGEYMLKEMSLKTPADGTQNLGPYNTFELFPSMYLSYSLPKNNELQLNYSRRVNRARGRQINPFRNFSDSTKISYGNPNLSPEYANSVEFNYMKTWDSHSLSASLYYHFTDSVIENVQFRNGQTMESTYMNLAKKQNAGLEIIGKNQLFKILNLTSSLNLYYEKIDASVYTNPFNASIVTTIPEQADFTWSANILANFMLSKTLSGQITAEYTAPTLEAQGYESPEYQVDFGLRKTFLDRKLSLSLMAIDVFNFNKEKSVSWGTGFYQRTESYFHRRMIGLTVSYNFGNMKPKMSQNRKNQGTPDMMDGGME